MRAGEAWLRARVAGAPPQLLDVMVAALPAEGSSIASALAEGALALYAAVVRGSERREAALPLLAADALYTHAFQAQAEADPAGLGDFAARWGARGRLAGIGG